MDNIQNGVKFSGYLEKKGKMRMMSSFKKYWFVLEGRLLLYYRSKDEYEAISPCKGSITLGPPAAVKSFPSVPCGFQIESRTHTITLRAENPTEQKKWMHAIMSALNQNQNKHLESPPGLNHFRYSMDDLVPKVESHDNEISPAPSEAASNPILERQNTMPPDLLKSTKLNSDRKYQNEIIQRLRRIGAQTYGGSLEAITKIVHVHNNDNIDNPTSDVDIHPTSDVRSNRKSSSQFSLPTSISRNQSADSLTTTAAVLKRSASNILRGHAKESSDNIYERVSGHSNTFELRHFMVDNDNYSAPINKRFSLCEEQSERKRRHNTDSDLTENECYYGYGSSVLKNNNSKGTKVGDYIKQRPYSDEVVYSQPSKICDRNKNCSSELIENSYYAIGDLQVYNRSGGSNRRDSENEYEDPDKLGFKKHPNGDDDLENLYEISSHFSEPEAQLTPTKEKCNKKNKQKKLIEFRGRMFSSKSKEDDTIHNNNLEIKQSGVKKSKSFIRRVWKRKSKNKDTMQTQPQQQPQSTESTAVNDEDIYEEVDRNHDQQETLPPQLANKVGLSDENTVQLLSELHNILEYKRPILQKTLSHQSSGGDHSADAQTNHIERVEQEICPELPPKQNKSQHVQDHQSTVIAEPVRSLDEILEDLSKERREPTKTKVKMLIEKFSGSEQEFSWKTDEEEVVLRNHCDATSEAKLNRHSDDELTRLLDELAKVTCAPIMTPGVTSSLVNPMILTDEQWLKLVPIRQRRLSEPDYDIPRPHKSLQQKRSPQTSSTQQDRISDAEEAIQATRFFGPALSSAHGPPNEKVSNKEDMSSCTTSMTPDSLEMDENQRSTGTTMAYSYNSHEYHLNECDTELSRTQIDRNNGCCCNRKTDDANDIIYAMPKKPHLNINNNNIIIKNNNDDYNNASRTNLSVATHIVKTTQCQNICISPLMEFSDENNTIVYKNVRNNNNNAETVSISSQEQEMFKDSLETCTEF